MKVFSRKMDPNLKKLQLFLFSLKAADRFKNPSHNDRQGGIWDKQGRYPWRYIIGNLVSLTEIKSSREVQHNNDVPQYLLDTRKSAACPGKKKSCWFPFAKGYGENNMLNSNGQSRRVYLPGTFIWNLRNKMLVISNLPRL